MDWLRYNLGLFYSCSEPMRGRRQHPGVSQWHIWMVCYELSLATRPFLRRSHPSDFLVVAVLRHRFAVTLHEWCSKQLWLFVLFCVAVVSCESFFETKSPSTGISKGDKMLSIT